jgi:quinoprotein glucose dehydrogenase
MVDIVPAIICLRRAWWRSRRRPGEWVWHAQLVHHGLWDYDLPAAPNLVDITVAGKPIKAVAQGTKQEFCFVFDRITGEPIWPIEERPVLQSTVPGEKSSPTQPFPSRPAPFERQGLSEHDVIDFTPALRQEALAILRNCNYGPLFTPPSEQKPTIVLPIRGVVPVGPEPPSPLTRGGCMCPR